MSPYTLTDRLADLIERKHDVLTQLCKLSACQFRLAGHDQHIDDLMRVVATKQTLIERLLELDRHIDPFRAQPPESRTWRSEADRTRCSGLARECQAMLDELRSLEVQGTERVQSHRNAISRQLQETQSASGSIAAYHGADQPALGSFDLSAE
jgi:flagellar biosynthesis/type III secretory pathway chaperone